MRKSKILIAMALSVSLTAFTGQLAADSHMAGYKSSVEYSQYRDEKSTYRLRASDIIGLDLENAHGDNVGEIDDLIVLRKDDQLMAVISVGGFLGIGDRLTLVPYEDLRLGKDAGNVYWDVTKKALEGMSEFKYDGEELSGNEAMTLRRQARADSMTDADAVKERAGYDKAVEYSKYRKDDSVYKLRVSEILGEEIENAGGDDIGEVDDVVIPATGKALQAIVSVGGFLGIGDRLVMVPYDELRIGAEGDELYLNVSKEDLAKRPAFGYNEGERMGNVMLNERKRYVAEVRDDLKSQDTKMAAAAIAAESEAEEEAEETKGYKNSVGYADIRKMESPYHLRMSDIIGEDVENAQGDEIGEIDDLVLSRKDDSLLVVISVGGFLGIGDKLVSVPYKDLRMSPDGDDVYLNSTKDMLESQPEFKYNEGEVFGRTTFQDRMKDN